MTPDQPAWMPPSWELRGEINVTPFIDVMLVLLIIFMVTAPMMMSQVPLKLPKTAAQPLPEPHAPVVVSLDGDGRLFLDRQALDYPALVARLEGLTRANPEMVVYVRGDRGLDYGRVMDLLGRLGAAGVTHLSLLAEGGHPPGRAP